ncbi:nitroreductase family protein [Paenibacillus glufosinatiresistens]|uniref:nitroreductase family protein n=1 Tax=Paenibacillus glufosinatiresistens TaxID=3070657 RepID=UPI00286E984C|nr:nitroreductase family protein [Paenibacillus sp. YX.27]
MNEYTLSQELKSADYLKAVQARRSVYAITKESPVSDDRIREVVEQAVLHSPSSFNSQSGRVIVLLGGEHDRLWDLTTETLRNIVPAEQFEGTAQKMNSFKSGYGTVLFFEDEAVIQGLQEQFALYADNFPVWANQSSGMLQLVVWTALSAEGLGASLQHYNPLIDEEVKSTWSLPQSWRLIAQMPFGGVGAAPGEKQFQPVEERVRIVK